VLYHTRCLGVIAEIIISFMGVESKVNIGIKCVSNIIK
jgi:hypothetical protein